MSSPKHEWCLPAILYTACVRQFCCCTALSQRRVPSPLPFLYSKQSDRIDGSIKWQCPCGITERGHACNERDVVLYTNGYKLATHPTAPFSPYPCTRRLIPLHLRFKRYASRTLWRASRPRCISLKIPHVFTNSISLIKRVVINAVH